MWTEASVIIADIQNLLSEKAAGKLVAKVVLPKCEECGHLLTHRGEAHGYIVHECAKCKIPYIQAGQTRPAVERDTDQDASRVCDAGAVGGVKKAAREINQAVRKNGEDSPSEPAATKQPKAASKVKKRPAATRKTKPLRRRKARA